MNDFSTTILIMKIYSFYQSNNWIVYLSTKNVKFIQIKWNRCMIVKIVYLYLLLVPDNLCFVYNTTLLFICYYNRISYGYSYHLIIIIIDNISDKEVKKMVSNQR